MRFEVYRTNLDPIAGRSALSIQPSQGEGAKGNAQANALPSKLNAAGLYNCLNCQNKL